MNKKMYIGVAVLVVLLTVLGVYVVNMNNSKGNNFIDFSEGKEKVCSISNNESNVLLVYTNETKSYVGSLDTDDLTITSSCELPFENNENLYIEQDTNKDLYISNGVDELFKFNGSHFLKVPYQTHSNTTDVRVTTNEKTTSINLHAGSVNVEKEFTYTTGFMLKNAYVYSNVSDVDVLNLYGDSDPGTSISDSFVVMRVHLNDSVYYAFFDVATKELTRFIANPFETTEGAFYAVIEEDKPILFVGGQALDVNANEMIAHDAVTIDEANVSVETKDYSDEKEIVSTHIKGSDGNSHPYVIQSKYAIDYAYVVIK